MLSYLWKIVWVVLAALAIFAGLVVAVAAVLAWPHSPFLFLAFVFPDLVGSLPSVLLVGVPAYLLVERLQMRWRRSIAAGAATALSVAAIWLSAPVMHQCLFSNDARLGLAKRLSPEEVRTIECLPVEGSCFCPSWFQFRRDGRVVQVWALEDIIHGTKYHFDPTTP